MRCSPAAAQEAVSRWRFAPDTDASESEIEVGFELRRPVAHTPAQLNISRTARIIMKLESKLGLSTGLLVAGHVSQRLCRAPTHGRGQSPLRNVVTANRLPLIMHSRDLRSHFTDTVRALESYILFGIDPNSSAAFRERPTRTVRPGRSLPRQPPSGQRCISTSGLTPRASPPSRPASPP